MPLLVCIAAALQSMVTPAQASKIRQLPAAGGDFGGAAGGGATRFEFYTRAPPQQELVAGPAGGCPGVSGNGSIPSAAALESCINGCLADTACGGVVLPAGEYLLERTLRLTAGAPHPFTIRGDGKVRHIRVIRIIPCVSLLFSVRNWPPRVFQAQHSPPTPHSPAPPTSQCDVGGDHVPPPPRKLCRHTTRPHDAPHNAPHTH